MGKLITLFSLGFAVWIVMQEMKKAEAAKLPPTKSEPEPSIESIWVDN